MGMVKDFKAFINRGNAIDMAVGIIVGSVMTSVVNSLVKDVMMPPIGVLVGGIDFSDWKIALGLGTDATINICVFLNTIIWLTTRPCSGRLPFSCIKSGIPCARTPLRGSARRNFSPRGSSTTPFIVSVTSIASRYSSFVST